MKCRPVSTALSALLLYAVSPVSAQPGQPALPPTPSADFPFESRFVEIEGSKIHYVDEGGIDEGAAQVFVFLHGNPTSSYLWRNVIPHVTPVGRAVAMDLIGFGKSDKPDIGYTLQEHQTYVDGFIEALELEDIVLVVHDWGSMLGLDYARRHSDNVKGVVFMEAILPPAFPMESVEGMGGAGELFAAFRKPETGKPLLIDQNLFIEQIVGNAAVTRAMSEAEMTAYRAPFLDPATRFPIYVWPNELPIGGEPARNVKAVEKVGQWLRTSVTPKLLLYARPGAIVGPEAAQWMAANYRNIETRFVGYGAHYIQEDNPEVIGRSIADWYRQLSR